jgi:hypothetical protein
MTIELPLIDVFGRGGPLKSVWYGDCLPSRDFPMLDRPLPAGPAAAGEVRSRDDRRWTDVEAASRNAPGESCASRGCCEPPGPVDQSSRLGHALPRRRHLGRRQQRLVVGTPTRSSSIDAAHDELAISSRRRRRSCRAVHALPTTTTSTAPPPSPTGHAPILLKPGEKSAVGDDPPEPRPDRGCPTARSSPSGGIDLCGAHHARPLPRLEPPLRGAGDWDRASPRLAVPWRAGPADRAVRSPASTTIIRLDPGRSCSRLAPGDGGCAPGIRRLDDDQGTRGRTWRSGIARGALKTARADSALALTNLRREENAEAVERSSARRRPAALRRTARVTGERHRRQFRQDGALLAYLVRRRPVPTLRRPAAPQALRLRAAGCGRPVADGDRAPAPLPC